MKLIDFLLYTILFACAVLKGFAVSYKEIQENTVIIICFISIYFLLRARNLLRKDKVTNVLAIYLAFLLLSMLVNFDNGIPFIQQLNSFLFPSLFLSSYIFFYSSPNKFDYFKFLGIPLVLLAFWNVNRLSSAVNENASQLMQSNSGNLLVALVPYACLYKNIIIKYFLLGVVFLAVCISLKRSALVIFLLCMSSVVVFSNEYRRRDVMKAILYLIILFFFFFLISPHIDIMHNILLRMSESVNDGGSGRDVLLEKALTLFLQSDVLDIIFGHGYLGFSLDMWKYYASRFSCSHNDFSEILYDNGVIVLFFYCMALWQILRRIMEIYIYPCDKKNLFVISSCCGFVQIVSSLMVCSFVHFWYYLPMYCLLGAIFGYYKNKS